MRKLIGKGTFTKAYQIGDNLVEVISTCLAKECYALFSQGNTLAPEIEYLGHQTFQMPLYAKVRAPKQQLNAESYDLYGKLRKLGGRYPQSYQDFCKMVRELDTTEGNREELIELAGDVCNGIDCQDLRFEISPRNIAVGADGSLVLLDCFFSLKALQKARSH